MSEERLQSIPTEEVVNWDNVILHINNAEAHLLTFAGKPEHNPFVMINELGIKTLKKRLAKGERTKELYTEVMKLPLDAVPHVKNLKSIETEEIE